MRVGYSHQARTRGSKAVSPPRPAQGHEWEQGRSSTLDAQVTGFAVGQTRYESWTEPPRASCIDCQWPRAQLGQRDRFVKCGGPVIPAVSIIGTIGLSRQIRCAVLDII